MDRAASFADVVKMVSELSTTVQGLGLEVVEIKQQLATLSSAVASSNMRSVIEPRPAAVSPFNETLN